MNNIKKQNIATGIRNPQILIYCFGIDSESQNF